MLHLRHRERLLWPHPPRLRDAHPARAQLGQLPVSAAASRRLDVTGLQRSLSDRNRHCVSAVCGAGSSWCTWSTRTRRSTRVRCVSARVLKMPARVWSSSRRLREMKDFFFLVAYPFFFFFLVPLCNISTHLLCCIRAAGGRSNAWAPVFFFCFFLIFTYLHAPELQVVFIWCSHTLLMSQPPSSPA